MLVRRGCEDTAWEKYDLGYSSVGGIVGDGGWDRDGLGSWSLLQLCMQVYQPWRAFERSYGKEMVEGALREWVSGLSEGKREGRFRVMDLSVGEGGDRRFVEAGRLPWAQIDNAVA